MAWENFSVSSGVHSRTSVDPLSEWTVTLTTLPVGDVSNSEMLFSHDDPGVTQCSAGRQSIFDHPIYKSGDPQIKGTTA